MKKQIVHVVPYASISSDESPISRIIKHSKIISGQAPEWYEDDLNPVDFGPYRIVAYNKIKDGVHQLVLRDMERNVDIYMVGVESAPQE